MISSEEYYLWKKQSEAKYPWDREFVDTQFLRYERYRIQFLWKWYNECFRKTKVGGKIRDVSFYTLPVELNTSWKASIAMLGDYNYLGLSALYNSPYLLFLSLFPKNASIPKQYSLINIDEGKKSVIINKLTGEIIYCLIVEEWSYLPEYHLYIDVPYEKEAVYKFITENLVSDEGTALSLQSPLIGSPYVINWVGGVSLSSMANKSTFAQELIKSIQLLLPPEYRSIDPPKNLVKGCKFYYTSGINFLLAEKPYRGNCVVRGLYAKSYTGVKAELQRRNRFRGEYSIFSTLAHPKGNITQIWKELLKNFTLTEITLPYSLDDFIEADIEIQRLRKEITEDVLIQIACARRFRPSLPPNFDMGKMAMQIKEDFKTLLADIHKETESEYIARSMLHQTLDNLKRLAQSLARSKEKKEVEYSHLKKARHLIIDNFHEFIKHPKIKKLKSVIEHWKGSTRYAIIQEELITHPYSTVNEIFEAVKDTDLFTDIYDLQKFLDWLRRKGYVVCDIKNRYIWVGK